MFKKQFLVCLLTVLSMLHFGVASAITFEVSVSDTVVSPGGSLTADILVSGLGDFAGPSLGGYDLDLIFDDSLFSLNSVTFGNQLDLGFLGSFQQATPLASAVNLFEASFELEFDLDLSQAGAFTLASVVFDVDEVGTGEFGLSLNALSDSSGVADLIGPNDPPATIVNAEVQVVPVPAAVWLFGSGIIGLIGLSRRRRSAP